METIYEICYMITLLMIPAMAVSVAVWFAYTFVDTYKKTGSILKAFCAILP